MLPMSEDLNNAEGQARRLENVNTQLAEVCACAARMQRRGCRAAQPGEWSGVQVLGHMIEVVSYWSNGLQTIAAANRRAAALWAQRPTRPPSGWPLCQNGARSEPAESSARQFDSAATSAAAIIRAMTPAQRDRTGKIFHNSLGEISAANALNKLVVDHAEGPSGPDQTGAGRS